MLERGVGLGSLLTFFADSVAESLENARRYRTLVRSIIRYGVVCYIVTVVWAAGIYGPTAVSSFAVWAALGVIGFTAWACGFVALMRDAGGTPSAGVGLANYLTLARFYFIVPVLLFFDDGHYGASLLLYIVLGFTDVADGLVARLRNERTEFGVVMDPLADVFSTAAVFALFLAHGLVPLWLFLLLMARYSMLFVGSLILFLKIGPVRFKSTLPGKIVGLIQGGGVLVVVASALSGSGLLDRVSPVLFPVLGAAFVSIIVSQFVNGMRHLRSASSAGKAVHE